MYVIKFFLIILFGNCIYFLLLKATYLDLLILWIRTGIRVAENALILLRFEDIERLPASFVIYLWHEKSGFFSLFRSDRLTISEL